MTGQTGSIKRIGIVANIKKTSAYPLIRQVVAWLEERGIKVLLDSETHNAIGAQVESCRTQDMAGRVDLVVIFGGDGTILNVAQQMNGELTPIIGIKVGGLGFLTAVTEGEVFATLEEALACRHRIEKRMMLGCSVFHYDGSKDREYTALNDVVIQRDSLERMLTLETYVDNEFLASYACDGLIVSTPTGSTAHSLSAGGPIVYPETQAILLTPICPHMLTNRPLVLSADQALRIIVVSEGIATGLMIDGQIAIRVHQWDNIVVRKSPFSLHLAASSSKSYFEILRTKLNWGRR